MFNNQPLQCDFCFYSAGPFYSVRILPITPIATLSGTATPIHASIPGAHKIVCHHCRYSHYNLEPWTEPEEPSPSLPFLPEATNPPLTQESATHLAPPVTRDDNQSAHTEQHHTTMLPSIPPVSISYSLNEKNTQREKLHQHISVRIARIVSFFKDRSALTSSMDWQPGGYSWLIISNLRHPFLTFFACQCNGCRQCTDHLKVSATTALLRQEKLISKGSFLTFLARRFVSALTSSFCQTHRRPPCAFHRR